MKEESREWFDKVYEFMSLSRSNFGMFTQTIDEEDVKVWYRVHFNKEPDEATVKTFLDGSNSFLSKRPPKRDFVEEKRRVFRELVPFLREKLPYVKTGVVFGSMVGDIDIALIDPNGISDEQFYGALALKPPVTERYPIVDWSSLAAFRIKSGFDFLAKVVQSRFVGNSAYGDETNFLSEGDSLYVCDTVKHTKLLWGNKKVLDEMKKGLEYLITYSK